MKERPPARPGRAYGAPGQFRLKSDAVSFCTCDKCVAAQPWRERLREERKAKVRKIRGVASL